LSKGTFYLVAAKPKREPAQKGRKKRLYKVCFSGYPKYIFEKMPTNFKNFALSLKKQNITI